MSRLPQTINKAQGQTLERVGIYLPDPCFTHGQLYVAASRVGLPTQLRFAVPCDERTGTFRTRNIVFREILTGELDGIRAEQTTTGVDWTYDLEEDTSFVHSRHHGGGDEFHFCGPEPEPDEDAGPEWSAAVRALEAAEEAARQEYGRLVRLQHDDGAGAFDLAFYRQQARERVRQAACAKVAAMEAECAECAASEDEEDMHEG